MNLSFNVLLSFERLDIEFRVRQVFLISFLYLYNISV